MSQLVRDLQGKVALITGASGGIGVATARLLAAAGARVFAHYHRSAAAAEALVAEITAAGGSAEALAADLRQPTAVADLVREVVARAAKLDVLVSNAGVTHDGLIAAMTDDEWDDVFAVNVRAAFLLARAVARPMMLTRSGRIIFVSSVAGQKGGRGQANYAASKAALEGFTRALAVELAPRAIAVNAVAPGVIATEMSAFVRAAGGDEVTRRILLGRVGEPSEVARVIRFLASDDASYITGAVIPVDGGFKMA